MKIRRPLLILAAIVIVGLAWFQVAGHDTPSGQRPLAYLDSTSLNALKADFNRAAAETRLIVLLSPT